MPLLDIKFIRKNLDFICEKCEFEEEDKAELHRQLLSNLDHPLIEYLSVALAARQEEIKEFNKFLDLNILNKAYIIEQQRPLIVLSDKIDHLRVYTNIIIDPSAYISEESVSIFNMNTVFGTLFRSYNEDMVHPEASAKWNTPDRIRNRLNNFIDMPTARVLTRYLNFEAVYKPDQIRDMAEKFDISRKPMELLFADRPEDFCIMYGSGPQSCMSYSSTTKEEWHFLSERKVGETVSPLTPTSFYAYMPWSRGAYIIKQGKVLARSILFCDPASVEGDYKEMGWPNFNKSLGKKWYHGYIYGSNEEGKEELRKVFANKKISALGTHLSLTSSAKNGNFAPPENAPFDVPGVPFLTTKNYGCPFPYFDNMDYYGKGFFATFNPDTKLFTFTYHTTPKNTKTIAITNRSGYINSQDYIEKVCEGCGALSKDAFSTEDGHLYCTASCANRAGYKSLTAGNGHKTWLKILNPEEYPAAEDGTLFTCADAARQWGYYPPFNKDTNGAFSEDLGDKLVSYNLCANRIANPLTGLYYGMRTTEEAGTAIIINVIPIGNIIGRRNVEFEMRE